MNERLEVNELNSENAHKVEIEYDLNENENENENNELENYGNSPEATASAIISDNEENKNKNKNENKNELLEMKHFLKSKQLINKNEIWYIKNDDGNKMIVLYFGYIDSIFIK